jgi:hypothetical protein
MDDETQQFMRHWWSNKEKTGARTVDGRETTRSKRR